MQPNTQATKGKSSEIQIRALFCPTVPNHSIGFRSPNGFRATRTNDCVAGRRSIGHAGSPPGVYVVTIMASPCGAQVTSCASGESAATPAPASNGLSGSTQMRGEERPLRQHQIRPLTMLPHKRDRSLSVPRRTLHPHQVDAGRAEPAVAAAAIPGQRPRSRLQVVVEEHPADPWTPSWVSIVL